MLIVIYFAKSIILNLAFTKEFSNINDLIIWQLAGDFVKILTLAFGFQIVVKTMMKRYFIGEIIFNLSYFIMAYYLMKNKAVEGVLQAYFYANIICLVVVLIMFRKLFYSTNNTNR
jgi:PST family polysaccharide transporter